MCLIRFHNLLISIFFITINPSFSNEKILISFRNISLRNHVRWLSIDGAALATTAKSGMLLGGQLMLSGSTTATNSYKSVTMSLSPTVAAGTINATTGFGTFMYQEGASPTSAISYQPVTGNTITITEHNTTTKRIKGSFNCPNMTNLTNATKRSLVGSFDITY